ncbi:unnamed protein product [Rotaria socialis]|uniref:Uncharacterized protein n=2 Tax=Rotaria socialis TaxID=392032 RepID=A0A821SVX7_9BILA|nr:unnamed protein product [Rotaria socialis]
MWYSVKKGINFQQVQIEYNLEREVMRSSEETDLDSARQFIALFLPRLYSLEKYNGQFIIYHFLVPRYMQKLWDTRIIIIINVIIMVDNTSVHVRKVGGVRFTADSKNSSDKNEENPFKNAELQWEQCCDNECSFDLYFGILKLSHCYSMTMDVVFKQAPFKLETILGDQYARGLKLLVTEFPQLHVENRTSLQVEVIIPADTTPGLFHQTFLLRETSRSQQKPVTVNVSGKILRQGQGTATLRNGVHMKSIITEGKEDDE